MARHLQGPALLSGFAGGIFKDVPIEAFNTLEWAVYLNDFVVDADYDATNDFSLTQVTDGSAAIVGGTTHNTGALRLDAPAQNQGPIIQLDSTGIAFTPNAATAGTDVHHECLLIARFALRDADASDAFVGMAESNGTSAVLTAAGALTSDTHAGFHVTNALDGAFLISVAGADDTAAVTSSGVFTAADDEMVEVAVRCVGTGDEGNGYAQFAYRPSGRIGNLNAPQPWIDLGSLNTAAAWDAAMYPTIALIGDAAGDDLDLDYLAFAVKRDRSIAS